jgi:hypothetical protein
VEAVIAMGAVFAKPWEGLCGKVVMWCISAFAGVVPEIFLREKHAGNFTTYCSYDEDYSFPPNTGRVGTPVL